MRSSGGSDGRVVEQVKMVKLSKVACELEAGCRA